MHHFNHHPYPYPPNHHHDHFHKHHHAYGPCPSGRIDIIGKLVLQIKYVNIHGHVQYFDIEPGRSYLIEARSAKKGKCSFIGKIIDFDSVKGVEDILEAPHQVDVGALIVDTSSDYESAVYRINVKNIIKIVPVDSINHCHNHLDYSNYFIQDPFAEKKLEDQIKADEEENNNTDPGSDETTDEEIEATE